ncbi:hypothetical protein ES703_89564 [subsurface metagenome]
MSKKNSKGKTWKEHAAPYLRNALKTASRTWKPRNQRTNLKKVKSLRDQRAKINVQIKKELEK